MVVSLFRSRCHSRRRRIRLGVGLAVVVVAGAGAWTASATGGAGDAKGAGAGGLLWKADPALGAKSFEGIETKPGSVKVVDDPKGRYGKSYELHTSGKKEDADTRVRVETRGHRTADGSPLRFSKEGDVFYIHWRSMWGPLPVQRGKWVVLWQLKDYGPGAATPPLSLRARGDGTVDLEYCDPKLKTTQLWHTGLKLDEWNDFVVGIRISKDPAKGWVELWHDGKRQQLAGGGQRRAAATLRGDRVLDKWGVYRADGITGPATAYLNGAAVGRSYGDVASSSPGGASK
ncbi:heparin lyase I family protein [Streptomyces sp. NPDC057654]|uniref:heparin lyase I family protein n=1 Tax=Streptomyces sp. NPDC057654 TaxID=3346196 RepID=UPI0036BB452B